MDKPKDMILADALAMAIRKTKETIVLKRVLALSIAINVFLLIAVVMI